MTEKDRKTPPAAPSRLFDLEPPLSPLEREGLRKDARALVGTAPAHPPRDPRFVPRRRKRLR